MRGGTLGGGERDAQTIFDYGIEACHFPANANYVALGHLHRTQRMAAPAPTWYAGSPIQVDFGEEAGHEARARSSTPTPASRRRSSRAS